MPCPTTLPLIGRARRTRVVPLALLSTIAVVLGCSSGGGENGSDEVTLALTNVNTLPGLQLVLKNGAGVEKSWRVAGGSAQTGPIDLALTGADVEVLVTLAGGEELKLTPSQGITAGTEKSCRRQNGGATRLEVRVADLADARCTGPEWETPDPLPTVECLTPVIFSDDFAVGNQWTAATAGGTGITTHSESNNATGGNPGGYRHMLQTLPGPSSINVNHLHGGATYTPSTDGAIRYLHYSEDRIQFSPPFVGAAIGTLFYLKQAGFSYYATIAGSAQFTSTSWERGGIRRLIPAGFLAPGSLDFSATGGLITFGFLRGNTNNSSGGSYTTTSGIDNWTVVVCH